MLAETPSGGDSPPGSITIPTLLAGGVRRALATIFIEPSGSGRPFTYDPGDTPDAVESACRAARWQMSLYHRWASTPGARAAVAGPGGDFSAARPDALTLGVLVEGADGIRDPEELSWWKSQGVAAVGLAWSKPTRYAGGNGTELGLTDLGRAMVREIDRLGLVHDVSHLSDASLAELLDLAQGPVIASHSNARALLDDGRLTLAQRQRHLAEETIREIARRDGMIGSVLYSPFIVRGGGRDRRATLAEWAAHVERMCELMGGRTRIGLGSDADGGFSREHLPEGINAPADFVRLADTLAARGWSDDEVRGFAHGNWERFWEKASRRSGIPEPAGRIIRTPGR